VSCPLRSIHPGQRYTNQLLPSWESRLTDDEVGRLIAHFQKDHPDTMKRCRKRDFLASQVILKALRGIGYNYHAILQMVVHSYEKLGRYVDLEQLAQSAVQRNRDSAHNHPTSDSRSRQESRKRSSVNTEKASKRSRPVWPDPAAEDSTDSFASSSLVRTSLDRDRPLGSSRTPEQFSQADHLSPVPRLDDSAVNQMAALLMDCFKLIDMSRIGMLGVDCNFGGCSNFLAV
jgi:hypothetical protein